MDTAPSPLPAALPARQVIAINQPKGDLHTHRAYTWNGMEFALPPGVFFPGETARMLHQRVLDGAIETRDRVYAAMGVGLGAEAVAAALRGARRIYALDVHAESVATTRRHVERHAPGAVARLVPLVSDLFDAVPPGTRLDVVTFNPPAVSQVVSDDPDVVRNSCVGAGVVTRFFDQLVERDLLAPGGEVYVIASNTADLPAIVDHAAARGFVPGVAHRHDWDDGVVTLLFRFTRVTA